MAKALGATTLITISKTGGNASANSYKYRATLPNTWMKEMGVTKENREVDMFFNGEQIIIQMASEENFPNFEKATVKVQISVSGGGATKDTLRYNIAFLNRWMQELDVTSESRSFKREFQDGKIVFTKASDELN